MVNQLLGISSENEVGEIAQLFSDFVDGCLSVPVSLPGFAYHNAMNARKNIIGKINKIIADTRHGDTSGGGLVRKYRMKRRSLTKTMQSPTLSSISYSLEMSNG
ncbi:abietadienol/abietadienal oxidase [Tanacetum coccineum]